MEPWIPVALAIVTPLLALLGLWAKQKWDTAKSRDDAEGAEKLALMKKIEALTDKISDMQQERIAYEIKRGDTSESTMKLLSEMAALMKIQKTPLP